MNMLEKAIAQASQKYYTDGSSGISDAKFDSMMNQLKQEKPDSPLLTQVGHGYDVNQDTTPGKKCKHKYGTIGSLDKCHNIQELSKEVREALFRDEVYGSLKLDGLSVVLYYEAGKLVQALTRGRDNVGIDITEKAARILHCTEIKDSTFFGSVRGEILMSISNFEIFKTIHPEAENSRNSVAGLINRNDVSDELDLLDIIVYRVIGDVNHSVENKYTSVVEWLSNNFEKTAPTAHVTCNDNTFDDTMKMLADEWYGEYPSDGIVLTCIKMIMEEDNSYSYTDMAYKFQAEMKEAVVEDVEWSLSKTSYMIPRVRISPTALSGATVRYVTGFHAKYISDNKIGQGAVVTICRSGEVIPDIQEVIKPAEECALPTNCYSCGSALVWKGVHLCCNNPECRESSLQDALVWMNAIAPTDGLGDVLKIKFLTDIFGDNVSVSGIYEHGKITESSKLVQYQRFIDMFNSLFDKEIDLATAIRACNIPRFGDVTSGKLAQYPDIVKRIVDSEDESIPLISGLGEADNRSLNNNLDKLRQIRYISSHVKWEKQEVKQAVKVAITGKLSVSRSSFEKELAAKGFIAGSIGKDTKYLITDAPEGNSAKNKFASDHNIEKITELEFRRRFM